MPCVFRRSNLLQEARSSVAKIPVDFSGVESASPIPKGQYPGVIESLTYGQKEDKEFPSIDWKCIISEGEFEGRVAHMYTSFSPKALFKMQETFQNFGFSETEYELEVDDGSGLVLDPDLNGVPVMIMIANDHYQGRITSNIQSLMPLNPPGDESGGEDEPAPEAPAPKPAPKPTTSAAKPPAAASKPVTTGRPNPFARPGGRSFR